jgi:hypothetical protein
MPRLADLQADFAAALADPSLPAPRGLKRQSTLAQSRRFDVYRNTMMVSLIEAMEQTFPAVRRLVGADFFTATAKAYIRCQPPRAPVLLLYGEGFGAFLDRFEPAAGVPYIGDVARVEWARLAAYHAADAEPLSIARLAELPQEVLPALRIALHPSLQLLRSRWPVASLWAVTSGADPERTVDMTVGETVAVLRPMLSVELRVLPPGGYDFLAALAAGGRLGEAAECALAAQDDFDLARHLQGLFGLGAVTGISCPASDSQQT